MDRKVKQRKVKEMIELKSREQLRNAIERAHREAKNLVVKVTSASRQYRVINRNNSNSYLVDFFVRNDGRRFGHCTCKAGQNGIPCKHIAAAAALNIYLAGQGLLNRRKMVTQ
jgi:hypothetical protein